MAASDYATWQALRKPSVRTLCDAPNPGCPLITGQPAENLDVSCRETHT